MPVICAACGDSFVDDRDFVPEPDDLENAVAEIRYGNLSEAAIYLARAIPALDGLPPLVAKELGRREPGRADA